MTPLLEKTRRIVPMTLTWLWTRNLRNLKLILGDSRNYMPPILVPFSVKRIATQILVIAKLNRSKDFIFRVFVCDIVHPRKKFSVRNK